MATVFEIASTLLAANCDDLESLTLEAGGVSLSIRVGGAVESVTTEGKRPKKVKRKKAASRTRVPARQPETNGKHKIPLKPAAELSMSDRQKLNQRLHSKLYQLRSNGQVGETQVDRLRQVLVAVHKDTEKVSQILGIPDRSLATTLKRSNLGEGNKVLSAVSGYFMAPTAVSNYVLALEE